MKRLVVATTNAGKTREVMAALGALPEWRVEMIPAGVTDVEETGATFLENAILKAVYYSRVADGAWTLADDSGLSVDALGGRPGVRSARYAPNGEARIARLLGELQAAGPAASRRATFHCALAIAAAGAVVWTTETTIEGLIPEHPAGSGGFGYDPVFWIPALAKTLADLSLDEKNQWSARGQALMDLKRFLKTSGVVGK